MESTINDVTVLGGEGVKDFVKTVLRPSLSNKMRDDGERGSKNVQNCVTSLLDD